MAYAAKTEVPFERSIAEIVALVRAAGAARISQDEQVLHYAIQFTLSDRTVRFRVASPDSEEVEKATGPRQDARRVGEQLIRQRGRALLLVIKAKLESIESGVETFEQAFLANVVTADGRTVHERIGEQLALECATGATTTLLEGPRPSRPAR